MAAGRVNSDVSFLRAAAFVAHSYPEAAAKRFERRTNVLHRVSHRAFFSCLHGGGMGVWVARK